MRKKMCNEDVEFIQMLVGLGKTPSGVRTLQTDAGVIKRVFDLRNDYGSKLLNKTIDKVKTNYEQND